MISLPPLGIQSYCFRSIKEPGDMADALVDCGLRNVELWPGHLRHNDMEALAKALNEFSRKRIRLTSYGVVDFAADEQRNREIMAFAKANSLRAVSAMVLPDHYESVSNMAEMFDLRLAIHNHGKDSEYPTIEKLQQLTENAPEIIGICLDTAWLIEAGDDPVDALETLGDRVYGIHVKDFEFDDDGKPSDTVIGEGKLDLDALVKAMTRLPNLEFVSLEYEGDEDDPVPAVKRCVQAFEKSLSALE